MYRVGLTLLVVAFVLLSPVLFPVALAVNALHRRRLRAAAGRSRCGGCGSVLGPESVWLADGERRRRMDELRRKHPGVKFRVVRTLDAVCPACRRPYRYDGATRTFVPESARPGPAAARATPPP